MGNNITSITVSNNGTGVVLKFTEVDGVDLILLLRPSVADQIAEKLQLAANPPEGSVVNVGLNIEEGGCSVY